MGDNYATTSAKRREMCAVLQKVLDSVVRNENTHEAILAGRHIANILCGPPPEGFNTVHDPWKAAYEAMCGRHNIEAAPEPELSRATLALLEFMRTMNLSGWKHSVPITGVRDRDQISLRMKIESFIERPATAASQKLRDKVIHGGLESIDWDHILALWAPEKSMLI